MYHVAVSFNIIIDPFEANIVRKRFEASGKTLIAITYPQMNRFCGNVLQVLNREGEACWLMSSTAYNAFEPHQLDELANSGRIIHADISTIETLGGGSLRCMLVGIHAPFK